MRRSGQCDCGAVRFEAESDDLEATICRCGQCRRWSGYVWASIIAPAASLRVTGRGALKWRRSSGAAERGFCTECGSSLFWREIGSDKVDIALGALDDASGVAVAAEIFAEGSPPLFEPGARRPRHRGDRSTPLLESDDDRA